ncbi:MAG: hypothetical protein C5B59_00025 [Bacteroidetes bacterium]|nr:MAG: hypothetical protein C5B59_00025 [Bacteroidota bacterium]
MNIIDKVLTSEFFVDKPPVLVDIGASGEINAKWKLIAKHSVCLAFDADDREFKISEQVNKTYRKLITFNRIVTPDLRGDSPFYLTASPFCSSLLEPDQEKLKPWIFSELFTVEGLKQLPTITISEALKKVNQNYIDWFKTDTQGTDLRLFTSVPQELRSGILAAEFEPGILDAYKGEDKLFSVMQFLHENNYWLSSMELRGVQRLKAGFAREHGKYLSERMIRSSPGWAEVTYLREPGQESARQLLLLLVFSLLEKQYGFALEIAERGLQKYPSVVLFRECKNSVQKKISKEKLKVPLVIIKRQVNKIFSHIHN